MNASKILQIISNNSPHLSWINNRTLFLTRHGSHAYGTNIASSDEDFKGICVPTKEYFFGTMHRFEQVELKAPNPDTVIYDIRKFFNLAADCNPSIIEVLHTDPSDHILVSDLGQIILDHRNDFLSKKAKFTFSGYAISQLKRIKLHRKYLLNPIKEPPTRKALGLPEQTLIPQDQLMTASAEIQKELDRFQFDFMEDLEESAKIGLRNTMAEMLGELKITSEQHWMAAARKVGLDDNFIHLMQLERQYSNAKREWDQYQNWKKNRNPARAELEAKYLVDVKHAAHLIRLSRMGKEILSTGKVIVKRPDREELMAIRNGAWTYEQIVECAEKDQEELDKLYLTSSLPKAPNKEKLDQLCISLVEKSFYLH